MVGSGNPLTTSVLAEPGSTVIPDWLSLTVIVTIFLSAFFYARQQARHATRAAKEDSARQLWEEDQQAPDRK